MPMLTRDSLPHLRNEAFQNVVEGGMHVVAQWLSRSEEKSPGARTASDGDRRPRRAD
jgi:hypothetical protein